RFWRHCRRTTLVLGVVALGVIAASELGGRRAEDVAVPAAPSAATLPIVPAPLPSAPRQVLTVRVVAGGIPVADAEVALNDGSSLAIAKLRTDRDGIARFDALAPAAYELWATRAAQASRVTRIAEVTAD